jgi:Siphovirus Gp157
MDEPSGPGPMTIERVVSAWQRAQAELGADLMLEDDEAAINTALRGTEPDAATAENLDADQLLRRIVTAMVFAGARVAEAGDLEAALKARKQRYAKREETLRTTLYEIMRALSRVRFPAPEGTASIRAVADTVLITDLEALPPEYVDTRTETIRTPRKAVILSDLLEGVVIAGAVLSPGGTTLAFRAQRATAEV